MERREVLQSRSNPSIRRIRDLKRRSDDELMLLEGFTLLEEALSCGIVPLETLLTPAASACARGRDLVARLESAAQRPRQLDERLLASLSDLEAGQGVLAVARRPDFSTRAHLTGTPLIVAAVEVQNPGNLGALLRTAEAAGGTGAYLTPGTADPFSPKALRGAMGSAFRLPHRRGLSPAEICRQLRQDGVTTVATVAGAGVAYDRADFRGPVALFFGNEGAGLPQDLLERLDLQVHIPLAGPVESLNISVAAGVLLFEAARQRRG
jgi:RNA methyltransferase, TrmH family